MADKRSALLGAVRSQGIEPEEPNPPAAKAAKPAAKARAPRKVAAKPVPKAEAGVAAVPHLSHIVAAGKDLRAYLAAMPQEHLQPTNVRLPLSLTDDLYAYCDRRTLPIQTLVAALLDAYFRDAGVREALDIVVGAGE